MVLRKLGISLYVLEKLTILKIKNEKIMNDNQKIINRSIPVEKFKIDNIEQSNSDSIDIPQTTNENHQRNS